MTTIYKLTDADGYTRRGQTGETLWREGITITATGEGGLCTDGVVHGYRYPLLGLAMNPIHAGFVNPRLWECEGEIIADDGTKVGCKSLTCVRELPRPEAIPINALVRWAIYLAREGCTNATWLAWAEGWLSGSDRSAARAREAAAAARAREAAEWAAEAVWARARAREAAARAAEAAAAEAVWARARAEAMAWAKWANELLEKAIKEEEKS